MAYGELFNDTDDDTGTTTEITGDFELHLNSPGGGKWIFQKAISVDTDNTEFSTVEEFLGPAHRIITNPKTSQFRVILTGTKTSGTKKAMYLN